MRILLFLLTFLSIFSFRLQAQSPKEVQYIRQIYKNISDEIQNCLDAKEDCFWFCNRWTVNTCNRGNWSINGKYEERWNFWYDATPDAWEKNVPEESHLQKIIIDTETSSIVHEEYVFWEGLLVFYFYKWEENGVKAEYRFYFKKNRLVEYAVEQSEDNMTEAVKTKADTPLILENAKKFQKQFIAMMKL